MGILQSLSILALRQTVAGARDDPPAGKDADALAALLADRFAACGPRLMHALQTAAGRAWRIAEIELGGLSWWERSQSSLSSPSDQPIRQAVLHFLQNAALLNPIEDQRSFLRECGQDIRAARRSSAFDDLIDLSGLPRQVVSAWHGAVEEPQAGAAERRAIEHLVGELRTAGQVRLARLLELQATAGTPVLVAAIRACFHQTAARDDLLHKNLPWASAGTADPTGLALGPLAEALDHNASRISEVLSARGTGLESRGGPLDLWAELHRLGPVLQPVGYEVLYLATHYGVEHRELRPTDFIALTSEDERRRIRQLSARYRTVAEDQRRLAPALLNALGKLEAMAGELELSHRSFLTASHLVTDPPGNAEVSASLYEVALERRHWTEALTALRRAAAREPDRFAPFPIADYEPEAILRTDAFGVWFLCRHRTAATLVEVQSLTADVADRSVTELFREAQLLAGIEQPALLRQRDPGFADPVQMRPFLVADHFEGVTLAEWVEQHGPVPPGELLPLGRTVAEALQAAHGHGLLHRNLRPGNLLVHKDANGWRAKLMNFGLALKPQLLRASMKSPVPYGLTRLGREAARAMEYAAPEQLGRLPDTPLDPHTDGYSFGRTFYFALTRTPFPDGEECEALPGGWRKLLGHCTSVLASRRHANFDPIVVRLSRPATPESPAKSDARLGPVPLPKSAQGAAPASAKSSPRIPPLPKSAQGAGAVPSSRAPVDAVPQPRSETEQANTCIQRGVNLRTRGEFDRAITEFNRAIHLDPANAFAFEGRGNTYVNKGEFDRAIADYSHALRLDPSLALVHVNRGLAYVKKKDSESAIADYTTAIQLDPKLSLAFLNRGSAFARRGDFDRAIADYNTAIQLDSKLLLGFFNRGLAYAKKGAYEQAIADYDTVLKLDPTYAPAQARKREAEQHRSHGATGISSPPPPSGINFPPVAPPSGINLPTPPARGPAPAPAAARAKKKPAAAGPVAAEPSLQPRQVRLLEGHLDAVRGIAYLPDGRRVITASEDKTLRIWDIKTAKTIQRYAGHTAGVSAVAVSPDGERVLSGGQDKTLRLWDIESGEEKKKLGARGLFGNSGQAHGEAIVSVAFSPDGTRAISASWDKTLRLWDIEASKELKVYEGHQWLIHSVAFSPDGQHFIYGSEDQTARLCEVETGEEIRRFEGHGSWVLSVAFSGDGESVLTGSADGTARLWHVARGKEIRNFSGGMGLVQCVAMSSDSTMALTGEYSPASQETALFLWNPETGDQMGRLLGHQQLIWSVAFSPDGKYAATASADMTARIWRLR